MGKESLIKSTAKKGKESTKTAKKKTSKKAAPVSEAKKTTKAAAKPSKAVKKPKTAKTTKAAKASPKAMKNPVPKVTLKDLIFKQFDSRMPQSAKLSPAPDRSGASAPPFITVDDPAEAERLHRLLLQRFSMDEIKAAAKAPVADVSEPVTPPDTRQQPSEASAPSAQPAEAKAPAAQTTEPPAESPATPEAAQPEQSPAAPEPAEEPAAAPVKAQQAPEMPAVEAAAPQETPSAQTPPAKSEPEAAPLSETTPPQSAEEEGPAIEPPTTPSQPDYASPAMPVKEPPDPVLRAAKIGAAVVALIVLMIIWTSVSNSRKFFIVPHPGTIEILRGEFSPTGKQSFAVLRGYQLNEALKSNYTRKEIFPLIFGYYLDKADALLEIPGLPDFQAITDYLEKADRFALTGDMRDAVQTRMGNIKRMALMYKADVDASKATVTSLESALATLTRLKGMTSDPAQAELVEQKIVSVTSSLEAARKKMAEEAAAAEKAAGESPSEAPSVPKE